MSEANADDDIVNEMLPAFIEEANEQIEALEQLLLELEAAPDDRKLLDTLFRCAHTVKGSAGVFGLDRVVSFTHHVEALLDRLREGFVSLSPALSTLLLQSNDVIRTLVNNALDDQYQVPEELVLRLKQATQAGSSAKESPVEAVAQNQATVLPAPTDERRWKISVNFGVDTFRHGIDPLTLLNYVRALGSMSDVVCETQQVPSLDAFEAENCYLNVEFCLHTKATLDDIEQAFKFAREDCELSITALDDNTQNIEASTDAASASGESPLPITSGDAGAVAVATQKPQRQRAAGPASGGSDEGGFIRVQADRLDEVINLLGELVIAGAGASMLARQTQQRTLVEANQQVARLIEGIRNSTLKLRMVPIGDTFARFRRVVRDTATELGKDVMLEIKGGETELDKAMIERIADPLMHLVRNALDHGLETPEQRSAAGKCAQGKLTLSACHEGGNVLIRIIDDGRGVQRDKVLQRAWDRGLVDQGVVPPETEILNLIFAPGFSTAEKVTNLSGRGVGMDVVRSNVEALRGTVSISSNAGQGSCIEIRLPLTLAIIDGFLVGVGPSKFILPLESVVEVIANRTSQTTVDEHGRSCVELRGQVLPVVNLRTLYALDSPQPELSSVVVVRSGMRHYGLMVDTLLGQHQTVIKPLGMLLRSLRGVSGSSILGTGEVALIFDTTSLGQLVVQPRVVTSQTKRSEGSMSPIVNSHL